MSKLNNILMICSLFLFTSCLFNDTYKLTPKPDKIDLPKINSVLSEGTGTVVSAHEQASVKAIANEVRAAEIKKTAENKLTTETPDTKEWTVVKQDADMIELDSKEQQRILKESREALKRLSD